MLWMGGRSLPKHNFGTSTAAKKKEGGKGRATRKHQIQLRMIFTRSKSRCQRSRVAIEAYLLMAADIPTNFQSTNDGCSFHSYISQIENCRCSCISEIGNMKWQEVWGLCRPVEPLDRHDICQNFYTSRFPKKMKFTSKMRVICDISDCWLLILNQAVTFILISTQMNIWILIFDNLNICHTQSWNYISEVEVFHFSNGNVFNGFVLIFRVHPLSLHF